jgi:1,4-dihydroxy-6-naphthoate synthase
MFHGLASGAVRIPGVDIGVQLHDVEQLNRMALDGVYDVTKISSCAYLQVRGSYVLLNAGAAMGFGCGPIVVTRADRAALDMAHCRFAVPGELTTGHLLLRLWNPDVGKRVFVRYDRVMPMVEAGEVEAGVVIHEGRFVYQQAGLRLVQDLGRWWESRTDLPLPLGCVVAKRSLGQERITAIDRALRQSIQAAMASPGATLGYMREHAQELDEAVIREHVCMFVNEYSLDLGETGRAAMKELERMGSAAGVLS